MSEFCTEVYRRVGGRDLSMRCYLLERPPQFGLVAFHGGGWVEGSPAMWHNIALELVSRGGVIFLPEYRLLGAANPGVVLADLVADAHAAFRWASERCERLGLAEGRLGVGGGSAGGHLALSLVLMTPAEDQVAAPRPGFLLLCNPVADCSPEGFGGHILGAEWEKFSPLHLLKERLPPCFIVHGTADTTTPIGGVRAFRDRAVALGGRCELHEYEGRRHAFFNHPPDFEDVVGKMADFLASLGFAERGK